MAKELTCEQALIQDLRSDLMRLGFGTDDPVNGSDLVDVMFDYFRAINSLVTKWIERGDIDA